MSCMRGQNAAVGAYMASWKERPRIAPMSAPAAKYSSSPAITMQRISGSASHASQVAHRAPITSAERALRVAAWLIETMPTRSRTSLVTAGSATGLAGGAAAMRLDGALQRGDQVAPRYRLDQVREGAGVEMLDDLLLGVERREHDGRGAR